jgi:hypothetical protein
MIRGIHGLVYSAKADAVRAFLRDKIQLPCTDIGEGWLIFDFPEGDLGVHPTDYGAKSGDHNLSFYCDDIEGTVADLKSRGVKLDPIEDRGYGFVTHFTMPGNVRVQLYEPKYEKGAKRSVASQKRAKRSAANGKRAGGTPAKRGGAQNAGPGRRSKAKRP